MHVELRGLQGSTGVDVTSFLVSLLKLGTLESLDFRTSYRGKVQLASFCNALQENQRLESLVLQGMDFRRSDGRSILQWILQTLKERIYHSLASLSISSEQNNHFAEFGGWSLSNNYEESPEADKIQYLLWLNKYGLEKFRDGDADASILVELLSELVSAYFPAKLKQINRCCTSNFTGEVIKTSLLYDLVKASPHLLFARHESNATSGSTLGAGSPKKRKFIELQA